MERTMLKSKIHRATVTGANLNYVGSITIDEDLMDAADLLEHERIQVVNCNNGERFETYVLKGVRGSRAIELNGAAARLVQPGDIVILMSYAQMTEAEAHVHRPVVVLVNERNEIVDADGTETHEMNRALATAGKYRD
ncbi:MAG: aspartate 1-decarboxylase [Alicyclobacillaceae bacterium]|jgi:aspartate 1-decarboxylase|uniref:aspartate 1-decarboxylase n=1 Tax=Alicyclobacillus sp. SP_1 TaxID=2942475 RepID=UPI0021587475|nr:aspartate 1-decarboxylase [Alicyclobacillus sp. SP_1]MCY0887521.1 aspartate 1-decarboxylase [Alicyclobacillaceae bacterium]MCY0895118.1 aspartate 1-decarboxylase [Alicyclobacillaceae bacterium]